MKKHAKIEKGVSNVFLDLGFPPDEAHNLLIRSDLAIEIKRFVQKSGLTQKRSGEAARPDPAASQRPPARQDCQVQPRRARQYPCASRAAGSPEGRRRPWAAPWKHFPRAHLSARAGSPGGAGNSGVSEAGRCLLQKRSGR